MPTLDLNACFPEAADGTHAPLPKQKQLIDNALSAEGPKYTAYVGGVGSGKTVSGCMVVLSWAILHPGDYLVARQYMPELSITTWKTFLEITPPSLIAEVRIADRIIRIRGVGGKISNVIFRQLYEVDKLRSLNLSGFYIDEASQVPEAAFMLLQGRLRGKGLRKGILTTNPAGHDWIYRWFVKKDMITDPEMKKEFALIQAPSTENVHLPDGYVKTMLATWSEERVQREIYGSFDSFEGAVYNEFRRDVHVIKPFAIPSEWTRVVGIDHGFRNPAAWVFGAVDYDGNVYIYREFYKREWLIEELCKGKGTEPGVNYWLKRERIEDGRIDPSTRARRGTTGGSDYDAYVDHLPKSFPLLLANNEKTAGIDRVKSYLKVDPATQKPRLMIFDTCPNLIEEMVNYRYAEMPSNQVGKASEKEEPVKVDDHALDALRYLLMSRPDAPQVKKEDFVVKKYGYASLEAALSRDLDRARNKPKKDPFGDI